MSKDVSIITSFGGNTSTSVICELVEAALCLLATEKAPDSTFVKSCGSEDCVVSDYSSGDSAVRRLDVSKSVDIVIDLIYGTHSEEAKNNMGKDLKNSVSSALSNSTAFLIAFEEVASSNPEHVEIVEMLEIETAEEKVKNGNEKIFNSQSAFIALGVAGGTLLVALGNMKVVRDRENRESAQSAAALNIVPISSSNSGSISLAANSFDLENERNAITIPTKDSAVSAAANHKVEERTTVDVTDSGTFDSQNVSGMNVNAVSASMATGDIVREHVAPAGKLGVVVESTVYGPQINSLRENSPLVGIMKSGDLLLEIQGVDVRNMSATKVTKLMTDLMGEERTIKFIEV